MSKITESEFYMWRAVFALAHADNIVTDEEVRYMAEVLEDIAFTPEQSATLTSDIRNPQDAIEMFKLISDEQDQSVFFKFAKDIVWVDGDYGAEEQEIMLKLKENHMAYANVDDLVGTVKMEFDEGYDPKNTKEADGRRAKKIVFSFREQFLRKLKD